MDESEQRNLLMETAILGKQADMFLKSDVGQYLLARADERCQNAYKALKVVSPLRERRVRDLQAEIWKCESFRQWLVDAINEGQYAEEEMLER